MARFERDAPRILGALLAGAVHAEDAFASTEVTGTRMADFQRWSCAAMPAFGWTAEDFITATNESGGHAEEHSGQLRPEQPDHRRRDRWGPPLPASPPRSSPHWRRS